jgi:hypothetical protein
LIGGDAFTTSLFPYFNEEEQDGVTRRLCGAQPTLFCMVITRLPILSSAALLYFAWIRSGYIISYGDGAVPPEVIPFMLAIGGMYAIVWNVSGFITPD